MFRLDADRAVEFCDGLRRRDFLHAGALTALGLSLTDWFGLRAQGATDGTRDVNCIFLMLVGGPSQLDTFDMKPNAPVETRGPARRRASARDAAAHHRQHRRQYAARPERRLSRQEFRSVRAQRRSKR